MTSTSTVRLRASYRYASPRCRDEAVVAAIELLGASQVRYAFTLGTVMTVDVDIPLFVDHDYAVLAVLERGSVESRLHDMVGACVPEPSFCSSASC